MSVVPSMVLSPEEREQPDHRATVRSRPLWVVQRAKLIRMAADGVTNQEIAAQLHVSRPPVPLWRARFLALRLPGLEKDAPRPGRIPTIPARKGAAVVKATLPTTPPNATRWSTRPMAKAQGLSEATVRRIRRQHRLKPLLVETFKLSRDKRFVEKLHDVVGLDLNPPDTALVLCVDEKPNPSARSHATHAALATRHSGPADSRRPTQRPPHAWPP